MPSSPSSFYTAELQRALTEQAFGIKSFQITSSTSMQATASVTLLEGNTIIVNLATGGYFIESQDTIHETIEVLLQTASPSFGRKQQEQLMNKLAALS
ncbi:hypothetical protein BD779DRAFT_1668656 [Infundibulicybe gibba]|nr:hypothetical protein BD779DRAFT_1668656 [Infundibulicybe gibba]